jgi:hypothetical protein
MFMFETKNGKQYTFKMKDGEHFYRFYGDGKLPSILGGSFTDHVQGQHAWDKYCREVESTKPTPLHKLPLSVQVEKVSRKDDLLALAATNNIDVPEHMVQPAAIKKYLKGQVSA